MSLGVEVHSAGPRFQTTIYIMLREIQVVFPLFPIISWFLNGKQDRTLCVPASLGGSHSRAVVTSLALEAYFTARREGYV